MRTLWMAIIFSLVTLTAHGQSDRPTGHVRSTDPFMASLIETGSVRSDILRRLIARVDHSDVIVYVQPMLRERRQRGLLSLRVVSAGGSRFLQVRLRRTGRRNSMLALLAHELQHAVEIADRPAIVDMASATSLLAAIDNGTCRTGFQSACYETTAAQDIGRAVAAELRQSVTGTSAD